MCQHNANLDHLANLIPTLRFVRLKLKLNESSLKIK